MDGLTSNPPLHSTFRSAACRSAALRNWYVVPIALWAVMIAHSSLHSYAKEPATSQTAIYDSFVAAQRQDAELHSLFALSSDRIWVVGERGLILASEDGGIRWKVQESGTTCSLRDVYFADPLRGWAVGYAVQPFSHRLYGVVLSTTDGGQKWTYTPHYLLPPLHGIRRTETGNLIIWGGWSTQLGSSVFESLDAGRSWSPSPNIQGEYQLLVPQTNGWIGASEDGSVIQWALHQTRPVGKPRQWSRFQCDGDRIFGIDSTKQLLLANLATSSSVQTVPLPDCLSTFDNLGLSKQSLFVTGYPSHVIARSEDLGHSWQAIESPVDAPLNRFIFLDENRGWAISQLGDIIATRDGGKSWWIQRTGFSQLGMLFVVSDSEKIPWTSLAYCATELQRSTGLVVVCDRALDTYSESQKRRRIQAAASSIGITFVQFVSSSLIDVPHDISLRRSNELTRESQELSLLVRQFTPEVIVIGRDNSAVGERIKKQVLQGVLEHAQALKAQNQTIIQQSAQRKTHKVYSVSHSKARSIEITGSLVLKKSGKLLGDVTQRATTRIEEQVDLEHAESLLLIYAENPGDGSVTDIGAGFLPSLEASRRIELGHQGNLQVVLGSTARRKSLQRLLDSSRRESIDDSWDDYFQQVVASLTRDELEPALIWLADRLREQGKWLQWQMVAETLIRRQPDSGAAEVMWRQLLVVAASAELNHWQAKETRSFDTSDATLGVVTASATGNDNPPTSPFAAPTPNTEIQNSNVKTTSSPPQNESTESTAVDAAPTNLALMQWIGQQLPIRHPILVSEPDVLLQLNSWFRRHGVQSPLIADVQNGLKLLSMQGHPQAWQTAAAIETSLWTATGSNLAALGKANAASVAKPNFGPHLISTTQSLERPLLDGLPDDLCWQQASSLVIKNESLPSPQPATEVRIAFDEEWLFVWIRCERDALTKRSASAARREYDSDLANEDRVRFTLDIDRDRVTTFQFEVDQRGLTRDSCWNLMQWNPRWFVAQHHTDTEWCSEFAIPLAELCANQHIAGSQWCVGIERQSGERLLGQWPQNENQALRPIDLGILQFMTAPVAPLPITR